LNVKNKFLVTDSNSHL